MSGRIVKGCVLTVDGGNSSTKAVVWVDGEPRANVRFFDDNIEALLPIIEEFQPAGAIYSSVGRLDAKFLESLRLLLDGRLEVLTPASALPIKVEYRSRSSLGVDRIAAASGADALSPKTGALVVDAGTAVTIDLLSPDSTFCGGNIAPGMALRFKALHDFTSRLPLVHPEGVCPDFGHDTVTAIRAGVIQGMASEVQCAMEAARRRFGDLPLFLTGNDAPVLAPVLGGRGLAPRVCLDLVGRGLLSIFNCSQAALNP